MGFLGLWSFSFGFRLGLLPHWGYLIVCVSVAVFLSAETSLYKVSCLDGPLRIFGSRGPFEAKSFVRGREIDPPGAPGASCGGGRRCWQMCGPAGPSNPHIGPDRNTAIGFTNII